MRRTALLLALCASACATGQPAEISYGGAPAVTPPQAARVETPAPRVVRPRDASTGGTPLIAYALQPEEAHPFDPAHPPHTHRVAPGDTLYAIASRYQVPLRALIEQNHLEPPFALEEGQTLEIPPPRVHQVAQGETFEAIARAYNVDLRSLGLMNRMAPPYAVRPGDQIVLPAMARALEAPPAQIPDTPVRTAALAWPVRGDVLTRFGVQPNGRRSDGVEIAAAEGAPIRAAADGEVVYAGADLPAYGTLILVRHENGFVTAYGYARTAAVREGQRVRQGDVLGEVGRHDGAAKLLFQVRQGRSAADPLPLLGAG